MNGGFQKSGFLFPLLVPAAPTWKLEELARSSPPRCGRAETQLFLPEAKPVKMPNSPVQLMATVRSDSIRDQHPLICSEPLVLRSLGLGVVGE